METSTAETRSKAFPPHRPIKYPGANQAPAVPRGVSGQFNRSFDDRLWLFTRQWEPPDDQPVKATLIINHGTVDHSGVYQELGERLAREGIAVFASDMRGWGLSDGEPMYMNEMETFVRDVVSHYERIHRSDRHGRVRSRFVLGKSIGGLIGAMTVASHPDLFGGLIGLSGAFKIDPAQVPPAPVVAILRLLARIFPKKGFRRPFDPKLITSDPEALRKWEQDPLASKHKLTFAYAMEFLRCQTLLPELVPAIKIPMLMQWGSEDKVATLGGHKMMIEDSGSTDTSLKIYEGGYHNLLSEPALKDQVMTDIQEWIIGRSQ
jgi:alpha-beta hydrolase superfamily lysophospholipase